MRIEIEKTEKDPQFPCVMECIDGAVVLFSERGIGTCLVVGKSDGKLGRCDEDWSLSRSPENWKPFEGVIHISN